MAALKVSHRRSSSSVTVSKGSVLFLTVPLMIKEVDVMTEKYLLT